VSSTKVTKGRQNKLTKLAALTSSLVGRLRMLARAGIQYAGRRDIYQVAGYPEQGTVQFEDFWAMYERSEMGGRIVDIAPKATWREPPTILEEDGTDGTPFTDAWEEMADRLDVFRHFERVDRLAGVGRYGVLFIGTRGTSDVQMQQPLTKVSGAEDIIYFGVYHEKSALIKSWITDPGNPRFGLPESYQLGVHSGSKSLGLGQGTGMVGFPQQSMLCHASRCLHVAEDLVQDEVFGRPRLERILNRLMDMDKIAAGVGEGFWQAATRILQGKIDPTTDVTDAQLDDLESKMTEIVHDLRRQFIGQGMEMSWLPVNVETPKDISELYFALISVGCGIPQRILFGNEQGKLASTTDEATFFGTIAERQQQFAEPMLVRAFIDKMLEIGALPPTKNSGKKVSKRRRYMVEWPPLFELTELEQADANLKRAQTAMALTPMGGDPLALVEIDEDRNVWLVQRDPGDGNAGPIAPQGTPAPDDKGTGPEVSAGAQPPKAPGGAEAGGIGSGDGQPTGTAPPTPPTSKGA